MSNLHKRGLHKKDNNENSLLTALRQGGHLFPLMQLICKDENLTLEIRDNYLNIYYDGGNVARIDSPTRVPDFDKNYFRTHKCKEEEDWYNIDKQVKEIQNIFMKGLFEEYVIRVKNAMLNYWSLGAKGIEESLAQHQICICNTMKNSDYSQLDVEYEVSTKSDFKYRGKRRTKSGNIPKPRFDIIAIRNCDQRLCVIELKKGSGALAGHSGVQEHAESFDNTIGYNEKTKKAFISEMKGILNTKQELGLIDERLNINENLDPEFIFAYQYLSTDQDKPTFDSQKELFKHYQENRKYDLDNINHAKNKKVIWLDENVYTLKD